MLRKKIVALVTALAFMLTLMPSVAFAEDPGTGAPGNAPTDPAEPGGGGAESEEPQNPPAQEEQEEQEEQETLNLKIKIKNFDDSEDAVIITFKATDDFALDEDDIVYISIDNKAEGQYQYEDGEIEIAKSAIEEMKLEEDSPMQVRVKRVGYKDQLVSAKYVLLDEDEEDEDEDDEAFNGPKSLAFYTEEIEVGDDQEIIVEFTKSYNPRKKDTVRLLAYDVDGKRLKDGHSKTLNMADESYVKDGKKRIDFNVDVPEDTDYYRIEYFDSKNDNVHYYDKLSVTEANAKKLVLEYDSKDVALDEEVTPKVFLEDKNGKREEVSKDVTFVFTGDTDAIAYSDKRNGKIRVKKDETYVGDKIVVTASMGKYSVKETLTVVEKAKVDPAIKRSLVMTINSNSILVDNQKASMDAIPVIKNDRTFVPYRVLAENFGAQVDYDDATRAVTVTYDGKVIVMTVGKKGYTVNGKAKEMDVEPYISNDRTMVPVRFVAEAMGFDVEATFNPDGTTDQVIFKN